MQWRLVFSIGFEGAGARRGSAPGPSTLTPVRIASISWVLLSLVSTYICALAISSPITGRHLHILRAAARSGRRVCKMFPSSGFYTILVVLCLVGWGQAAPPVNYDTQEETKWGLRFILLSFCDRI